MEILNYKDKHEYTNKNGVTSVVYLMDCMDLLKQVPEKYFELAVVDPPYGILNKTKRGGQRSPHKYKVRAEIWDNKPSQDYWLGLFDKTENQIVCGGNYFTDMLPPNNAWIFWYKHQPVDNYADGEFLWTSFKDKQGKCFDYMYYGAINSDADRFHPTQKPQQLYEWIFKNYAKPNDKILDTHLGSGSSRIAADKANLPFVGCELDPDYFYASVKRFKEYSAQQTMF